MVHSSPTPKSRRQSCRQSRCRPSRATGGSLSGTALSSVVLATVLGLAACSSPAALSPRVGPPPATAGSGDASSGAVYDLASGQGAVIVTDGGVALHAGVAGRISVDAGAPGSAVVSRWHGSGPQAELDLSCPTAPAPGAGACPAIVDVSVPVGAAVTVRAHNASVSATGLSGPLNLETVNGDVTVVAANTAGAPVQLTTRNGSVRAGGLQAPTLAAHTVNGDVDLSWTRAPDQVTADTTNGSLDLALPADSPAYAITARTGHGEPHLGVPTDPTSTRRLTLTTTNGSVTTRVAG